MRQVLLFLVTCSLLTACTVGIVKLEVLTPGASALPTPTLIPLPSRTTQSIVPAVPMSTLEPAPTATLFPPLITAGIDSTAIAASAQNVELVNHISLASATDVAVEGDFVYVADTSLGLQVVDVAAIHAHTWEKSPGLNKPFIGRGAAASRVVVQGERAYTIGYEGLRIIDISSPAAPREIASYHLWQPWDVAIAEGYAYIACSLDGLRVIDVSDATAPSEVGFYDTPDYYAQGVAVSDAYVYVAGSDGVRVLNISDPAFPVAIGLYGGPAVAWDVTVAGDYAYVSWNLRGTQAEESDLYQKAMSIFAISDNGALNEIGIYDTTGEVSDVAVLGDYAYVAAGEKGLRVVDISNPASPREVGFYDTPGDAYAVAAADDYIYIADQYIGLLVLRFVPPTRTPQLPTPLDPSFSDGWRRFTTADGLCTDWPLFIGSWYIGTGTTTVCHARSSGDEITWLTRTVPLGTRVTAVEKFPPGGGELYATDAGICWYAGYDWECQSTSEGYPYEDIRRVAHVTVEPVLMLSDAVVYQEQVYSIPEIVGVEGSYSTWIAVSGEYSTNPEIWVGTHEHGIVVIWPSLGTSTRYTTADGLPSNAIRDINTGVENDHTLDLRDVWVATDNGVAHWNGDHWTAYTVADGLPSNDVRGVASSQANTVWAATAGGAAYFDGYSWHAFTRENGLPRGDLNGVIVQPWSNQVWFSTRGDGLLVFVPD